MHLTKIVRVKKIGKKPTLDIEVDSNEHVFYGDNFVVSNSHSVSYAVNSYLSAWNKANHTKEFFLSYLYHAGDKQDPQQEIYELVSEAKLFNIETRIPNLSFYTDKFSWHNDSIYFGLKDIKSLSGVNGDKVCAAIKGLEQECGKASKEFTWMDVLIHLSTKINSAIFKTLASVGFFSTKSTNVSRNKALYQYLIFNELTASETKWIVENYPKKQWLNLIDCLTDLAPTKKEGGGTSKKERSEIVKNEIYLLENPPYSLEDDPYWIVDQEVKFLGCPVSLSRIDSADSSAANTTCKEIFDGKKGESLCVAANLSRINNYKVKKGKTAGETMAFLTIEDDTCLLDSVVCFPEARKKFEHLLYQGNNLLFYGKVGSQDNSFIIEKIHEIQLEFWLVLANIYILTVKRITLIERENMNSCTFTGFLTENPVLQKTESGVDYLLFNLVSYSYRKAKSTGEKIKIPTYLTFEVWDSGAKTIANLAQKGSKLTVYASARNEQEDDSKIVFRVNEFDFGCIEG